MLFLRGIDYGPKYYQLCDENGNPIDYTGYTIDAEFRKTPDSSDFYSMGVTWDDASIGKFQVARTNVQTTAMVVGDYGFDVVVTSGGGVKYPPVLTAKVRVRNVYTQ